MQAVSYTHLDVYKRQVQQLNRILRMDVFREEFYRKPLEAMLEVSGIAAQVLAQLNITVQSYQSLMEKLEVDISLVEKEKARIAEILEDYLKDVHENLGKIDHNSTITVRERPIKMLRLELPSWEENLTVYQLRINDFLNEITRQGIEWFERNENAQEYFGTQLTTKHLYDTAVSYTHLDVYKRQAYTQEETIQNLVKSQGEISDCHIERYGNVIYPVSYTHLDVYKRQA